MRSSSLQSPPCNSAEAANDALSGLLTDAGRNQNITIVSTDVQEISPGMFVAIATFNIEDLEEEETDDDDRPTEPDDEKLGVEIDDDSPMAILHGHALNRPQEASPAQDIPKGDDIEVHSDEYLPDTIFPSFANDGNSAEKDNHFRLTEEGDIEPPDDLKEQFAMAEEVSNTIDNPPEIVKETDALQQAGLTFEQLREEQEREEQRREEEELERLRREAVPLPLDQPVPSPASEA